MGNKLEAMLCVDLPASATVKHVPRGMTGLVVIEFVDDVAANRFLQSVAAARVNPLHQCSSRDLASSAGFLHEQLG